MVAYIVTHKDNQHLLGPDMKDQEFGTEGWRFSSAAEAKIYCFAARATGLKAEVHRLEDHGL